MRSCATEYIAARAVAIALGTGNVAALGHLVGDLFPEQRATIEFQMASAKHLAQMLDSVK